MKRARVAYAGAIHAAAPLVLADGGAGLRLEDGRLLREDDVVWLPPFEVGTVIALGLNYADHAKELAFSAQEEPLVFLKGPGTLLGHRGQTRRPAGVKFMHYECELAVVIGRTARRVPRAQAMEHIDGLLHRERLCNPRLSGELVPPESAGQESGRRDGTWALVGRCGGLGRRGQSGPAHVRQRPRSRSRATPAIWCSICRT